MSKQHWALAPSISAFFFARIPVQTQFWLGNHPCYYAIMLFICCCLDKGGSVVTCLTALTVAVRDALGIPFHLGPSCRTGLGGSSRGIL